MNKAVAVPVALSPVLAVGAGIYYAPDFMWQWVYNLRLPITIFAIVVAVISFVALMNARDLMKGSAKASSDYAVGEWRAWTAVNTVGVVGLLWLLVNGIPSPDFKKQLVHDYVPVKVVQKVPVYSGVKTVYKVPTYEDAFDKCKTALHGEYEITSEQVSQCHRIATEAAMPPYRTITRTITLPSKSDYGTLFKSCLDSYDVSGKDITDQQVIENRNIRMELCRKVALTGSTGQDVK